MYKFTVKAGQAIGFDCDSMVADKNYWAGLRLFAADGTSFIGKTTGVSPTDQTDANRNGYFEYNFAEAGTYYLGVSFVTNMNYFAADGTGDSETPTSPSNLGYKIYLTPIDNLVDGNDTLAEAGPVPKLTRQRTVVGSIDYSWDVDIYKIQVQRGKWYTFDTETSLFNDLLLPNTYLRLFDARGRQLRTNANAPGPGDSKYTTDAFIKYKFRSGGVFYIGVSNEPNIVYNQFKGGGDLGDLRYSKELWRGSYKLIITPLKGSVVISSASALAAAPRGVAQPQSFWAQFFTAKRGKTRAGRGRG